MNRPQYSDSGIYSFWTSWQRTTNNLLLFESSVHSIKLHQSRGQASVCFISRIAAGKAKPNVHTPHPSLPAVSRPLYSLNVGVFYPSFLSLPQLSPHWIPPCVSAWERGTAGWLGHSSRLNLNLRAAGTINHIHASWRAPISVQLVTTTTTMTTLEYVTVVRQRALWSAGLSRRQMATPRVWGTGAKPQCFASRRRLPGGCGLC